MGMTPAQQIRSTLQAELQHSEQLAQLIASERQALTQADSEALATCIGQKQPIILQLEQLSRQRDRLLNMAGFPTGKSGMEAFIANQQEDDAIALQQLLILLRKTARHCREQNQINGGIVNVNRQYLLRALTILRGRDPESSAYGPGGEYTSAVVRQPLIGRV